GPARRALHGRCGARPVGLKAGQVQLEARASLRRSPDLGAATVGHGYRAHDRKAQTGATRRPVARVVGAVEAVEDALALLGCDPGAIVLDGKAHALALGSDCLHAQAHEPTLRRAVLDGVG